MTVDSSLDPRQQFTATGNVYKVDGTLVGKLSSVLADKLIFSSGTPANTQSSVTDDAYSGLLYETISKIVAVTPDDFIGC